LGCPVMKRMERIMIEVRPKDLIKVLVVISILFFSTVSSGSNEDETLLREATRVFSPLPQVMLSEKNRITPEKVELGKILFYETRISADGTVSCSKCHPMGLYGADGLRKAIGENCEINPRNSPTIFNVAGQISEHWTGKFSDVEDQAKQSIRTPPPSEVSPYPVRQASRLPGFLRAARGPNRPGMAPSESAEKKLRRIEGYKALFLKAFPGDNDPVTLDNFGKAVGAFERTLTTPSAFDVFLKGRKEALTEEEKRGLKTFIEIGCATCHFGTYVGGQTYRKFGLFGPYWKFTKSEEIDEGRYEITKNALDRYVFKVPVLRNVAKTPPYFHDGSVDELRSAELIMGRIQLGKDLTKSQLEDIVSFLKSLTGRVPEDAFRVPLLPSAE